MPIVNREKVCETTMWNKITEPLNFTILRGKGMKMRATGIAFIIVTALVLLTGQQSVNAQYIDIIEKLAADLDANSTTAGRDAMKAYNEALENETKGFTSAERDVLDATKRLHSSTCPSKYPELRESCEANEAAIDLVEKMGRLP